MAKKSFVQRLLPADGDLPDGGASRTLTEQTYAELRTDIIEGRSAA